MKILLVDDKAENLYILEIFLQRNGNTTVAAVNGAEALAIALKSPPDIVVSDILMPVMDGFVLCREWKKNKILQKIPFVFYSATYTAPKDQEFALSLGADRFIVKPQDLNDFLQVLKEIYDTYRMKTVQPMPAPAPDEKVFLKEYNEALVRKLEDKMIQLEAAEKELREKNAALEKDIEERKRAVEALNESEQRFHRLFVASPDALMLVDPSNPAVDWPIVDCNEVACWMNGYAREELIRKSVEILSISKETPQSRAAYLERIRHESALHLESFHRHRDGHIFPIEISISIITVKGHELILRIDRDITERKKAEHVVRESEKRFRAIFDQAPIGMALLDMEGRLIISNSPLSKMVGYSSEELSKMKFVDFTYPEDADKDLHLFMELVEGKIFEYSMEKRYVHKNGNLIWANLSVTMLRDEKGVPHDIIGMAEDITERKRAEKELERSEGKFRAIFDNASDAMFLVDLKERKFFMCNAMCAKMLGYSQEEFSTLDIADIHPAEDLPFVTEQIGRFSRGGEEGIRGDTRFKRKDGSIITADLSPTLLVIAEKKYLLMIFKDITERKHAEGELLKLQKAVDSSSEVIFMTDRSGLITSVNPQFTRLYGYAAEEVVGRTTPRILKGGLVSKEDYASLWQTILDKRIVKREFVNSTKDGRLLNVEVSVNPVLDDDGNITAFLAIQRDVTERKHDEETKKSLEMQLQQSQKLQGIGTLASGIAHDFNNILGIILGYSTLLERLRENPQTHSESVAVITKAAQRGASLVKQLLIFARKTEPLFEIVNINETILEINSLLQETFPKTIVISTSLQRDLPAIFADAIQIHQVLLNLFVNARDAMPSRGTLSISTGIIDGEAISSQFSKATARQYVQVEVADTGIGMDEATRERIFEPFFTTKGSGKGTGLGLAVAFGIVEHHRGFIDVRSVPGKGTSFTVYLPIPEGAPEEVKPARNVLEEIPGGTETVLIIDDEEMLRELLKASLVLKGYTVLTAEDGMQGVEMYRSHQKEIAIVLSDLGLPILSGEDVFKKIREINPEAKIILASGFIEPEMMSEMYKAGLKRFIQKPYIPDEVLQKIREAIDTNG